MAIAVYTRVTLRKLLLFVYDNTYHDKSFAEECAETDMGGIAEKVDDGKQSLWLVAIGLPDQQRPERAGYHACIYVGDGLGPGGRGVEEAKKYISPRVQEYSGLYYLATNVKPSNKDIYKEAARAANLDGVIFWTTKRQVI